MRSERKCSIFDLLWPDPSIPEGESEKFVFLENKNIFDEKKYTAFLVLLGSTCVQKLRQFEFLTLAIKISFLFDFCTDVLLKHILESSERKFGIFSLSSLLFWILVRIVIRIKQPGVKKKSVCTENGDDID